MSQENPSRKRNLKKPVRWILLVVLFLVGAGCVVVVGVVLLLNYGKGLQAEAQALYQAGDCPAALELYDKVDSYPSFAGEFVDQAALEQTECLALVQAADIEDAASRVQAFEQFLQEYPHGPLTALAEEGQLTAYLNWGEELHAAGDFEQAIAVYDEMATHLDAFASEAREPRRAAYLDWGAALTDQGAYAEAEAVYWTLLHLEQLHWAPLPMLAEDWTVTWRHPYGLGLVTVDALRDAARMGPIVIYDPYEPTTMGSSSRAYAIVGTSPSRTWYAVSVDTWVSADAASDFLTIQDVDWQHQRDTTVVWLPAAEVDLLLTDTLSFPLPNMFVQALIEYSEAAAQAVDGLQTTYSGWAQAASDEGDWEQAATVLMIQAELVAENSERQAIWQQVAYLQLAAAEALADEGEFSDSLLHTRQAEGYDVGEEITAQIQSLQIDNHLALGEQAARSRDWEAAAFHFGRVIELEQEIVGAGWATVAQSGARLWETPDADAQSLRAVEAGRQFPALAKTEEGEQNWVLLLVSSMPTPPLWIPAEQISLTVSLSSLPNYQENSLPDLQSHTALVGLAQAHQAWGQELYEEDDYQAAVAQYQVILDSADMQEVITGTGELAARALTDFGDELLDQEKVTEAVPQYAAAIAVASDSTAAGEARSTLFDLAENAAQALADGEGCDTVPVLDALVETVTEQRARQLLPQALYQCGQFHLGEDAFTRAKLAFQRVVDEYPYSSYAARAERGMLEVDWFMLLRRSSISSVADDVCEEAASYVQAGVYTLTEPHIVYVDENHSQWSRPMPDSWLGDSEETTVIVCREPSSSYLVERCPYTGGYSLERHQRFMSVRIVDPVTRRTVAQGKIYGSMPGACQFSETFTVGVWVKYRYGDYPTSNDLVTWLRNYLPE